LKINIHKTIILSVVLIEAWSLKLKEECRKTVFENKILRRKFVPKRDANREQRRLHNEKLHNLYRSTNKFRAIWSRRLRWADHIATMEEGRRACEILKCTPTGNRPLERQY
jgi:hypothetical protein